MFFLSRLSSDRIKAMLSAPGKRYAVRSGQAQGSSASDSEAEDVPAPDQRGAQLPGSPRMMRWFDRLTKFAGSRFMLFLVFAVLLAWVIAGIIMKGPVEWQIWMNDGSSIQVYIINTLLIHQFYFNNHVLLSSVADMQSRSLSIQRQLSCLARSRTVTPVDVPCKDEDFQPEPDQLPKYGRYDQFCNALLLVSGSWYAMIIYWAGIVVWLGFGQSLHWGNFWQLVINTATAVELTFTTIFLQHVRRRQMEYVESAVDLIQKSDDRVLERLSALTGTKPDLVEVEILPARINIAERFFDYYAAIVGGVFGMVLFIGVIALWIAIGPVMHWSSNWWLIIGTYTGLISFIDEFVLRNMQLRDNRYFEFQIEEIAEIDRKSAQSIQLSMPQPAPQTPPSFFQRLAAAIIFSVSRWESVVASFVATVAVIAIASGMLWNETGQLICNTPTMIIEGYLMLVLLHSQRRATQRRRVQLNDLLLGRLKLANYLEARYPMSDCPPKGPEVVVT